MSVSKYVSKKVRKYLFATKIKELQSNNKLLEKKTH